MAVTASKRITWMTLWCPTALWTTLVLHRVEWTEERYLKNPCALGAELGLDSRHCDAPEGLCAYPLLYVRRKSNLCDTFKHDSFDFNKPARLHQHLLMVYRLPLL